MHTITINVDDLPGLSDILEDAGMELTGHVCLAVTKALFQKFDSENIYPRLILSAEADDLLITSDKECVEHIEDRLVKWLSQMPPQQLIDSLDTEII